MSILVMDRTSPSLSISLSDLSTQRTLVYKLVVEPPRRQLSSTLSFVSSQHSEQKRPLVSSFDLWAERLTEVCNLTPHQLGCCLGAA